MQPETQGLRYLLFSLSTLLLRNIEVDPPGRRIDAEQLLEE